MSDVASSSELVELAPLKILIVDNDARIATMHATVMNKIEIDVDVRVVRDLVKAINLYFCGSGEAFDFDIIFIERDMPIMDGKELAKELRRLGITTLMVGLISCCEEKEIRAFKAAGLDECLVKPITTEEVLPLMQRARRNRKPA